MSWPRRNLTVLVTGAGAPGIRGTLFALHRNPERTIVRTVGVDAKADVVGRYLVDVFEIVPAPESPEYIPRLLEICHQHGVELIVPQTTREIAVLSIHREALRAQGLPVMVSGPEPIRRANSKWELLRLFQELGLPFPAYELAGNETELREMARALGYPERPVVVKPPVSNGMRGLRILKERAWDVRRFLAEKPDGSEVTLEELVSILRRGDEWPGLLVCEYLPGPEYSVDVFLGSGTQVAIPRLRRAIRSGISFENIIEHREDVEEYSIAAGRALGLEYAVGFQYKLDHQGIPKILESNPRIQGTMVASLFAGVNVIWASVEELLGAPPRELRVDLANQAVFYRFWGGLGIHGEHISEI